MRLWVRSTQAFVGTLLVCSWSCSNALAYDGVTEVGEFGKKLVAYVREAHEKVGFSGAVLAGKDGKVIAAVAVGTIGDGSDEPLAVDSLFEIASCTKSFTAIAVMKLAEAGKLALDDSIAVHLPGVSDSCRAITVRHLLQHTSGISPNNSRGWGKDLKAVLPTFLEGGPLTPPGEKHAYWNQGYALLSEVIARASRKSYTRYLREAIFEPCKMKNSCFTGNRPPKGVLVATGKSSRGADRTALEHPYGEYGFQYRGMGGLVTNLIDLWRWDRTLSNGELLSTTSITEMTTPDDSGYALGWRIKKLSSGGTVHEHTGSVRGFLASIQRNPADDGCLFVLCNSDDSGVFGKVKRGCEAILQGGKATVEVRELLSGPNLKELIGVYRDDKGRDLTIADDNGQPTAKIDWGGVSTRGYLLATDTDKITFSIRPPEFLTGDDGTDTIEVERGADQAITAIVFTITDGGTRLRFARIGNR